MSQAWFVRAGREDEFEDVAFAEGVVGIGWHQVGDLTACSSKAEIASRVAIAYPGVSKPTLNSYAIQLHVFRHTMQPDDVVVLLRAKSPDIGVGRITSDYRYAADKAAPHLRSVEWSHRHVRRSEVPSLTDPPALSVVFRVGTGSALDELQKLVGRSLTQSADETSALSTSAAYDNLSRNLNYARNLTAAGSHLEQLKVSLFEVTDVYRAAWVQAVAAIDHWVHQEVCDRMVRLSLDPTSKKPPGYSRFQLPLDLVEKVQSRQMTLQEALSKGVKDSLAFKTYQSPDKIQEGFNHVTSVKGLWNLVANVLNERAGDPKSFSGNDIQLRLKEIVHRRNKIAHEYDEDPSNPPHKLSVDAQTTMEVINWLDALALALLVVLDQE
jgi:restriction system protein